MKLIRTFHPVGHGAFYTERFYDEQDNILFTAVFDCGCFEAAKLGCNAQFYEKQIATVIQKGFTKGDTILRVVNGIQQHHCTPIDVTDKQQTKNEFSYTI